MGNNKIATDLKTFDAHVIKPSEYEDAPELTAAQLRRGRLSEPTLWVTDSELIRRSGVPYKIAHAAIQVLDQTKGSGFPPKQRLWGNRRYWPSVKLYFDKIGGLK